MKNKIKNQNVKSRKILNLTSSLSGTMSFLGGYQVCHNICLGIIALLSLVGITLVGMPLLFLTKVPIPFWTAAVVLFIITLIFYFKKKCISKNLIILNAGIIVAGIPFKAVQNYASIFWIIGGILVILSLLFYIHGKITKRY